MSTQIRSPLPDHSAPPSGTWESLVGGSIAKLGGRVVFKVGGALGDTYGNLKRRVEAKIPLPGNGRGALLEADGFIACNTCSVEPEAISKIRENYRLGDSDTVAAGRTDIPGLESDLFEGLSRTRRQEVGLRSLDEIYGEDRPIQSPNRNAQASRHAEEDIFNSIAK